tara:strand:+ start:2879 stop:3121 length:243 start_codon:yes stop_codon:yes gene_type:complete
MPKYKKVKPEIVEGLLDRFFGKIATKSAERAIKDIKKKDPELGNLLDQAKQLRKRGEARLAKMTKQERDDDWQALVDKYM